MPEDPRGQVVYDGPAPTGPATVVSTNSGPRDGKSFTSSEGPSMSAAPISAAMPEPMEWDATWDEPMEWDATWDDNMVMDMPVPTLYNNSTEEDWEVYPMPGPADWNLTMPPMDELMDNIDWEAMPVIEDYDWESVSMPMEEINWDELTDPEYYYNQAEQFGYDQIIAESGLPLDFNSTTDVISWDQEQMRNNFRDAFGWAIMGDIWDSREASTCNDRCNKEYDMCCVEVAMQDMNSQAMNYESYCMYKDSIMDDYSMDMMGYELKMKCDKDSNPKKDGKGKGGKGGKGGMMGDSAIRVASGIISAAVVMTSLY